MSRKYIEKFVGLTPKTYKELEDRHKKLLKIFSRYKFEKILDIGCGDGNFTMLIGKSCGAREICGVDLSEVGVRIARKNGIRAFKVNIDEEDLPFEDNYFDAVFAGEIIEHLFDPDHFLDEVYRVLRPNGIFVLTTPNLASLINRIALLLGYQPFYTEVSLRKPIGHMIFNNWFEKEGAKSSSAEHVRLFTLRSLKLLLKMHNYKIIKILGCCYGISKRPVFGKVITLFNSVLPSLSIGLIVVSEAIK